LFGRTGREEPVDYARLVRLGTSVSESVPKVICLLELAREIPLESPAARP
jgi:hypothetical protein